MSNAPKSHRELWVTEMVSCWAVNDWHVIENAIPLLESPEVLVDWIKLFIRTASARKEVSLAAWEIRQELAPADYDRIDWTEVVEAVRQVAESERES